MREERRIKIPKACSSSTGRPLIHGLSSFSHHSSPPICSHHSLLFSALSKHSYVFHPAIFISPPLPVASPTPPALLPSMLRPPLPSSSTITPASSFLTYFSSSLSSRFYRTLGMMAPCTSPRWRPSTWGTTVVTPTAMRTCIRHMCCRWMVSSGFISFLQWWEKCENDALVLFLHLCGSPVWGFCSVIGLLRILWQWRAAPGARELHEQRR